MGGRIFALMFGIIGLLLLSSRYEIRKKETAVVATRAIVPAARLSAPTELPDYEIRCDFEHRVVCFGGESCQYNEPKTFILISKPDMTYKRCGDEGCDTRRIEAIGPPQPVRNISMGSIGAIVKYGPGNNVLDIVTTAFVTVISSGTCHPADSRSTT